MIAALSLFVAGIGAFFGAGRAIKADRKASFFTFAYIAAACFVAAAIVAALS